MNLKDATITQLNNAFVVTLPGGREYSGRMYEYEGLRGLGVSTCTDCFVPVERQDWYKRTEQGAIETRTMEAASLGTELHTLPEREAQGEAVVPREEHRAWFENWQETKAKYEITEELSEIKVFSKEWLFGGTIDRVGNFKGKRCIIDFKTGRYSHTNLWKTEAYRQAYMEMTGEREIGAVVLHLPRTDLIERGLKPRAYTIEHHLGCFDAFLSCYRTLRMYYFKELKKAGFPESELFVSPLEKLYDKVRKGEFV